MKKIILSAVAAIVMIASGIFAYFTFFSSPLKNEVTIELGDRVKAEAFLKKQDDADTKVVTDISKHLNKVGTYKIVFENSGKKYNSTLVIKDTKKPTATAQEVKGFVGNEVEAKQFVTKIKDASKVKVTYKQKPDFSKLGKSEVSVLLTDAGNNQTEVKSSMNLVRDEEAPVVTGLKNIVVEKGKTVSYRKGIHVKDNADPNPVLSIDNSKVNVNKTGNYAVSYIAKDKAGNTFKKNVSVSVRSYVPRNYSVEEVRAKAKEIVSRLGISNATQRKKCVKIFHYVHSHMVYTGSSDKSSWTKGAMVGMLTGRGDCFNYWAMTKALLDAAGVKNIDLTANTRAHHFWNFVKVENGWYHLDTTPRIGHPYLCLRTDAWMTNYSNSHKLCFKWNETNKPASAKV